LEKYYLKKYHSENEVYEEIIRNSLLEPGEQTGYTILGLRKMKSGQSIKDENCLPLLVYLF
jgi:hypothetical protein